MCAAFCRDLVRVGRNGDHALGEHRKRVGLGQLGERHADLGERLLSGRDPNGDRIYVEEVPVGDERHVKEARAVAGLLCQLYRRFDSGESTTKNENSFHRVPRFIVFGCLAWRAFRRWRRGWDSNPRALAGQRFSRPSHSTTLPPLRALAASREYSASGVGRAPATSHGVHAIATSGRCRDHDSRASWLDSAPAETHRKRRLVRSKGEVIVRVHTHRSRAFLGIALIVAASVICSTTPGSGAFAGHLLLPSAALSALHNLAEKAGPPRSSASKRQAPAFRLARAVSVGSQDAARTAAKRLPASALLGAMLALVLFGGWMLDYARRSSRTRGQPRMGVPVN